VPFPKALQLNNELDDIDDPNIMKATRLPGQPNIRINDHSGLWRHLERELYLPELEKMSPKLWLMSMQSSSNISALHRQTVKNRRIVITEDPQLHLVWIADRIYIKPLPPYLLSYVFWEHYLQKGQDCIASSCNTANIEHVLQRQRILPSALGFLRTYSHLIKHESDFHIAKEERLIPSNITWIDFSDFTAHVATIQDTDVTERYTYGELRLSRLNFYSKIFLRKFYFRRRHSQYGSYFAQFFTPLLFVFGMFSVVLSAMQVITASNPLLLTESAWHGFWKLCIGFSMLSLGLVVLISLVLVLLFSYRFFDEWYHAITKRIMRNRARRTKATTSVV
jgi:hypothetical protein